LPNTPWLRKKQLEKSFRRKKEPAMSARARVCECPPPIQDFVMRISSSHPSPANFFAGVFPMDSARVDSSTPAAHPS
jgi:hypothetical protein